jgi:hypothetical protein
MPNDDRKTVMAELDELNLIEARYRVSHLQSTQAIRKVRQASVERSLRAEMQRETYKQANCRHRKGGKGVEMMYQGNDSNFAVIKHIYPTGPMHVYCQRCGKEWKPPDAKLNRKGASIEDRREYARLYKEYQEAINFPTDNETSGSQLFMVTRGEPGTYELPAA